MGASVHRDDLPSGPVMFLAEVLAEAIAEQVAVGVSEARNGVYWLAGGCTPNTAGCTLNLRDVAAAVLTELPENVYRFARGAVRPVSPISTLEAGARAAAKVAPGEWESDYIDSEGGHGKFRAFAVFCDLAYYGATRAAIVDTHNNENGEIRVEHDEDGATSWDENARLVCEHIANFDPPTALRLLTEREAHLAALRTAEAFMSGFEGDELQDGIDARLAEIRAAIALAEGRANG